MSDPLHQRRIPKYSVRIIILSWLLVGTLDILSAFTDYYIATGKNPLRILNYIAGGVFGKPAFSAGTAMMLTGLLFHYIIALIFSVFFFWLYSRVGLLSKNWIITGIGFGIFIWVVMNLVVVPLSKLPHTPIGSMKMMNVIKAMLILVFMIGLPLSFIAYKYLPGKKIPA